VQHGVHLGSVRLLQTWCPWELPFSLGRILRNTSNSAQQEVDAAAGIA
jgi:hypothetical protein